jgi:DNA polymerase I-like protein with 3'-5' exonuclease and polymerase domains
MPELKPLILNTLNPPLNVTVVQNTEGLAKMQEFLSRTKVIAYDCETNVCNDFSQRKARTLQVGNKAEQYVIDLLAFAGSEDKLCSTQGNYRMDPIYKPVFDILKPILCSKDWLKTGVFLGFDYSVLSFNFGIRMWHMYSIDLAERVIQAGAISLKKMQEFSMASIAARRFGVTIDKELQTSFYLHSPLTADQINYAAFDVRMPLAIREHQMLEMTQHQLLATAQIENDALGAFEDMHLHGMKLDSERWMKRIIEVEANRKRELEILDQDFIPVVGRKTEQIDFEEMNRREELWRNGFEEATPEEMQKAEEIRATRDNTKKAVLRAELNALTKIRKEQKAESRRAFSELSKKYTEYKKKVEKCEGEAYLNYASNDQLLEALKKFKGMKTLESVSDDHLLKYNDRPMIQVLRRYRKGKKDTGTYGKQWTQTWVTKAGATEGWVHPLDGRIHARFGQLEAETGRTSSFQPNMQNLPRVNEVRACFIADPPDIEEPEGYSIVTIDMSGAELRIIAELANATSWINAFNKKWDVHSVSTEILEPVKWPSLTSPGCAYYEKNAEGEALRLKCSCLGHKEERDNTKEINFQLCYGGSKYSLADALGTTVDEAEELMRKHRKAFFDVWDYLEESGERAQRTNEARDLFGRRRQLPAPTWESSKEYYKDEHADRLELDEETQKKNIFNFSAAYLKEPTAEEKYKLTHREPSEQEIKQAMRGLWGSIKRRGMNHPVQGSNASIIKRAMGCGFDALGRPYLWHLLPRYKSKLLSMVHDECILQTPKRYAKDVAECVSDCFRRAAAEVMSKVEMTSEYHIADHWEK